MKIWDSHTHVYDHPEELLRIERDVFGFERIAVLGIPTDGILNDLACLRVKAMAPDYAYVYGGLAYAPSLPATPENHEKQLRLLLDAGCDGWKILETKPSVYSKLRLPLDSDAYARAFAFAQEADIPVTWHAGDPATFWSEETAPLFAVRNHWLCVGEGMPTLEEIYRQVECVLARYPALRVTLAHLYFTSDDRPHAEKLLDTFPCLSLDITPGSEMYAAFMQDPSGWTEFFTRYRKRLIFGTDTCDAWEDCVFGDQGQITGLIMKTLAGRESFTCGIVSGRGIGLREDVLQDVFHDNFARIVPDTPRPLSRAGVARYGEWLMDYLTPDEKKEAERLLSLMC